MLRGRRYLPGLLGSLAAQSLRPHEVLVVETGAEPGTLEAAVEHGASYYAVPAGGFDHGGTRSRMAEIARGDVLVFMSQDVVPDGPGALEALVAPLAGDSTVAAAFGRHVAGPDAHPFEVAKRLFNYPAAAREVSYADGRSLGYKAAFVSNAFAAYRRDALVRAGLFRERQLMCEDVCAAASLLLLGWRLAYRSDAVVRHAHPVSPLRSFRRAFDIGASHRQQIWILEHFGKVNREGARFVRFGISHLRRSGATARIPSFLLWCAAKQLGYQLGFRYELLPPPLRPALSAFPAWWSRGAAPAPSPTPLPELTLAASSSSATA